MQFILIPILLFYWIQYVVFDNAKEQCLEAAKKRNILNLNQDVIVNDTWLRTQDADKVIGIFYQSKEISGEARTLQCTFRDGPSNEEKIIIISSPGNKISQIESTSSSCLNPFNIKAYE